MTQTNPQNKNTGDILMSLQKGANILLVDDNKSTIFYNKIMIERTIIDAHVTLASNGLEALEVVKKSKEYNTVLDLIFLDIHMSDRGGWEFLEGYRRITSLSEMSIIILMSGEVLNCADRQRIQRLRMVKGLSEKMLKKETLLNLVMMHL